MWSTSVNLNRKHSVPELFISACQPLRIYIHLIVLGKKNYSSTTENAILQTRQPRQHRRQRRRRQIFAVKLSRSATASSSVNASRLSSLSVVLWRGLAFAAISFKDVEVLTNWRLLGHPVHLFITDTKRNILIQNENPNSFLSRVSIARFCYGSVCLMPVLRRNDLTYQAFFTIW